MFLPISKRPLRGALIGFALTALTACGEGEPTAKGGDGETVANGEQAMASDGAAIPCALNGAGEFKPVCNHLVTGPADATQLILEGPEGDFRRFNVLKDGRGLEAADGAEPATIAVRDDGTILVSVGADKFVLPATIKSTTPVRDTAPATPAAAE